MPSFGVQISHGKPLREDRPHGKCEDHASHGSSTESEDKAAGRLISDHPYLLNVSTQ